jgi:hypothetical protein
MCRAALTGARTRRTGLLCSWPLTSVLALCRPVGHLRGGSRFGRALHEGQQAAEPDIAPGEAETDGRDVSAAGDGGTGQHQLHALAPATRRVDEDGRRLIDRCRLSGWCAIQ